MNPQYVMLATVWIAVLAGTFVLVVPVTPPPTSTTTTSTSTCVSGIYNPCCIGPCSTTTTTTTGTVVKADISFLVPGLPFTGAPNYYTSQGPIQVQVPQTTMINMVAFLTTDRAYDLYNITVNFQDANGVTLSTGILGLLGPLGHNGDFADTFYPVQLTPIITLQANTRYQIAFSPLPPQDKYGASNGAGVAEGMIQAQGSPSYLGQQYWPIFELGLMNLNAASGQNRIYTSMTDFFSSPGYKGTGETALRFKASASEQLQSFELLVDSSDGTPNTLTFTLRQDSTVGQNGGSHPLPLASSPALGTASVSNAVIAANLTGMYTHSGQGAFVKVYFNSPSLLAGNYYWIVMASSEPSTGVIFARLVNPYRGLVINSQDDFVTWGVPADGPSDLSFRITTSVESIINTVNGQPKYNYFSGIAQSVQLATTTQVKGAWVEAEPNNQIMYVGIQADSGIDSPSGTFLAQGSTAATTSPFPYVAFTSTITLNAGVKYWLVIQIGPCLTQFCSAPSYAYGLSYRSDMYGKAGDYGGGALHYEVLNGGTWTTPPLGDIAFILASPTGYESSVLLGSIVPVQTGISNIPNVGAVLLLFGGGFVATIAIMRRRE